MTRSTSSASRRGRRRMSRVVIVLALVAAFHVGRPFQGRQGEAESLALQRVFALQLPTELPSTKFKSGQDVVPYFEGWIHNKDGSFDLVFGYFNRNWEEELAIPAAPPNPAQARGPPPRPPTDVFAPPRPVGLPGGGARRIRQNGVVGTRQADRHRSEKGRAR